MLVVRFPSNINKITYPFSESDPSDSPEPLEARLEHTKLLEIRSEMSSGQITGDFLAALQQKQVERTLRFTRTLEIARVREYAGGK